MKTISKLLTGLLLLVLLLVPVTSASAQGFSDRLPEGRVIFGDNFVLAKGDTLDGDLVVFGGNVTIEEGATVTGSMALFGGNASLAEDARIQGDVAMFGGNIQVDGKIDGDVAMLGGGAALGSTAVVDGDISLVGGNVEQEDGAEVTGEIIKDAESPTVVIPSLPGSASSPDASEPNIKINFNPFWDFVGSIGQTFGMAIVMAGIAMLASLFLQPQMERVGGAITSQPVMAGGFGLLAIVTTIIMVVTIILIPVSLLMAFIILPLAWMFGVIAFGQEVGERLTRAFHVTWSTPVVAGIGTFVLMLGAGLLGLFPCVGWIVPTLVGLVGLGAVALTIVNARRPQPVAVFPASNEPLPPAS